MPHEISAAALLQSDFDRIDEEVDRIAMAYCEAKLVLLAQNREKDNRDKRERDHAYKEEWHKLRHALLHAEGGSLAHLLYWLDIRAYHWANHTAPSEDAGQVADLLAHFANEAERLKNLAERARERKTAGTSGARGELVDPRRTANALHSLSHP
jgi:hypothetical protein